MIARVLLLLVALALSPIASSVEALPLHPRHARVVGGSIADPGSFGYVAFLSILESSGSYGFCTATVIGPTEILTAAHCVHDSSTGVLLPASSFVVRTGTQDLVASGGQIFSVTEVRSHPSYSRPTVSYDAALLFLAQPTTAPSLRLASWTDGDLTRRDSWVVGWGITYEADSAPSGQPQYALVSTQSSAYCRYFSSLYSPVLGLCSDVPGGGVGACRGDSGGPLVMVDASGAPFEAGITSNVRAPCEDWPTYYTASAAISTWVSQQVPPPIAQAPTPALPPVGAAVSLQVAGATAQSGTPPKTAATSATPQDSKLPRMHMFVSRLRVGVSGHLFYHVEDNSWHTREIVRVYDQNDRPVWGESTAFGPIRKASDYFVRFTPHHAFRGEACAFAQDGAGNWSHESCAPLVVTWR